MSTPTLSFKNSPFPTADHRPCRLAVFPVSVKPAAGGTGARHSRVLRNNPAMGLQIRCDLRKATAQKQAVTKGCLASGRGGRDDRRLKAMALASRRPGRICSRRDRASPSRHHGCEAIVDQTAEARPRAEKIITDKLRSYGAAKRDVIPAIEHRSHKGLNNRAEIPICCCENENE